MLTTRRDTRDLAAHRKGEAGPITAGDIEVSAASRSSIRGSTFTLQAIATSTSNCTSTGSWLRRGEHHALDRGLPVDLLRATDLQSVRA